MEPITNIPREAFETLSKGKIYGPVWWRKVQANSFQLNQTDPGECFLIFNSLDLLEIGIYKATPMNFWV